MCSHRKAPVIGPDTLAKRAAMIARAQEVAEDLKGTARSLSDFATDEEIQNKDFMEELDQHVFECEVCNWFCDVDEMAEGDGLVCVECERDAQ